MTIEQLPLAQQQQQQQWQQPQQGQGWAGTQDMTCLEPLAVCYFFFSFFALLINDHYY